MNKFTDRSYQFVPNYKWSVLNINLPIKIQTDHRGCLFWCK